MWFTATRCYNHFTINFCCQEMKKLVFIVCMLFAIASTSFSQAVINNPAFGMTTSPDVRIPKIEITKDATIIHFYFLTPADYVVGGWAAVLRDMYIRDVKTGKKFYLQRAENVPYYPEKHMFTGPGQELSFTLYFDPVDPSTTQVDIIENIEFGFNFFRVLLIDIA